MKKTIMTIVLALMTSMGCMAQEHVRLGVGAGINMTSPLEKASNFGGKEKKMLPGGEIYGVANIKLGEDGWMAEGRLGLSMNRWKMMSSWIPAPPDKDALSSYYSLSVKLPVMIGYKWGISNSTGLYGLIGPSVNYSPLIEVKYTDNWEDYDVYHWWLGANARVGVEMGGHHRIEAMYSINLTHRVSFEPTTQHTVGLSYGYMF